MHSFRLRLTARLAWVMIIASFLGGCATTNNPQDPFERVNRGIFEFNETLDRAIVKPVAQGYRAVLPEFIRSSVSNFFGNINDVIVVLNNLLQGKFTTAYADFGRVVINTTLGIVGLFDIASEAGIEKHDEDFGQTLGYWGIGPGPFIMLPILGPSTGRDVVGRFVDYFADATRYVDPTRSRNQLLGTRAVNRRAELLDASTVLDTAALDRYEFIRDAYLQRRRNLVYDGAPPAEKDFMDAPPKPKTSVAPESPFASPGQSSAPGSALVSGESRANPTVLMSGDPLTPAQWEAREPLQPARVMR